MTSEKTFLNNLKNLAEANRKAGEEAVEAFRKSYTWHRRPTDDDDDRHYDRNGYCDNPARGY